VRPPEFRATQSGVSTDKPKTNKLQGPRLRRILATARISDSGMRTVELMLAA
jgi:hypothetical protein